MNEEMERPRSSGPGIGRREFLKKSVKWGAGLFGLLALGGGYAAAVEPRWLEVVRTRLELQNLPAAFRGLKMVQFSDVHYEYFFGASKLKELMSRIMAEKPDIIVFTGDLVDVSVGDKGSEIAEVLQSLDAPMGKFAVLGNHDYFHRPQDVADVLAAGGFRTLRNESVHLEKDNQRLRLSGVEDSSRDTRAFDRILKLGQPDECCILMAHTPDFAARTLPHSVQLQLSGHSHGGQVRIPFYGKVGKVPGAVLFPDGLVPLKTPAGGRLQLYTNRGVGMTGVPVRFLCRPELTVHTLV
jgi:uncharacterized protein